MKTSKDKILEALGDLLPADTAKEVTEAVDSFLQEAKAELDKEYDAKIAEAYEAVTQEKREARTKKKEKQPQELPEAPCDHKAYQGLHSPQHQTPLIFPEIKESNSRSRSHFW
jgi:hypothetical protein